MRKKGLRLVTLLTAALALAVAPAVHAALLEVTHSPGAGQYATVSAALVDATDGDIIEIIDNSASYSDAVHVDGETLSKNDLTIRGQVGLDPKPVIVGNGTTNPWDAGIGEVVVVYSNNVDRIRFENIRFEAGPDDEVVADIRFWNGGTFTNCEFIGGPTNVFRSQVNTVLNDCLLDGGTVSANAIEHWFGGPLVFNNCTILGGSSSSIKLNGGELQLTDTMVMGIAGATINVEDWSAEGHPLSLPIVRSIVGNNGVDTGRNLIIVQAPSNDAIDIAIDNADMIGGGGDPANTNTGAGFVLNRDITSLTVTDTIFYNLSSVAYALNEHVAGVSEDYCMYKLAPNNLSDQGVTEGVHSIEDNGDPLYVDALNSDFRLQETSAAATLSSGNSPEDYAGSQGVLLTPTGDPDGDGLDNQGEDAAGTNALVADTDGDGLSDGDEVNVHGTDPLLADTDGDGVNDGQEIADGTNPLDPDSYVRLPAAGGVALAFALVLLAFCMYRRMRTA